MFKFYFLKENNPYFENKEIRKIRIEDMDLLTPMDIEEYLSYLQYYVRDGREYTNSPEGRARKLSCLRTFYDYFLKRNALKKANPFTFFVFLAYSI